MKSHAAAGAKMRYTSRPMLLAGLAATAAVLLALTGCGSSSTSTSTTSSSETTPASTPANPAPPSSGGAQTLALAANPEGQLKFDKTALTAKAGKVTIVFTNTAPEGHNVNIESASGAALGATPTFQGGSKTLSVTLKAGTYKFYCSVPGHRMAGMEGTLTVN